MVLKRSLVQLSPLSRMQFYARKLVYLLNLVILINILSGTYGIVFVKLSSH